MSIWFHNEEKLQQQRNETQETIDIDLPYVRA